LISFFSEDIQFNLQSPDEYRIWISTIIKNEGHSAGEINYIFCSDEYLWRINSNHLSHDTYTDIITFDMSDNRDDISGDIFISIERVKDNSTTVGNFFTDELDRVMIHGILHLCGYNDGTDEEKAMMRKKEEACLSLRHI
jgi:rRNA maturation RNase YbeY